MKDKAKQSSVLIIVLCWLAYTVAYLGRLNFNAYIEPIRDQLGASKTELGLVSSFFFFSYGAGQLFHGIMSKKYNTRYSVAVALIGSAAVNLSMSFFTNAAAMKYLWLLNGFFQSILWSSMIKSLADRLSDEMLPKAIVVMGTPPAIGTFIAYGMSALLSSAKASYKAVFCIPAIILAVTGTVWFIFMGKAESMSPAEKEKKENAEGANRVSLTPVFVFGAVLLLLTAISNGFIKDGVTTWTPSILKERYGMNESLSILVTVILPLIAVAGAWFSTALHNKWKNSSALNAGLYLAESTVLLLVMLSAKSASLKSPVLLIVLFSISALLMSAVNNIITSIIPLYMRKRISSGLLAGVLDTFCYVGSSLSTGLLGYISDKSSWNGVFLCLFIFGAAAFALCTVSALLNKKAQTKFRHKNPTRLYR